MRRVFADHEAVLWLCVFDEMKAHIICPRKPRDSAEQDRWIICKFCIQHSTLIFERVSHQGSSEGTMTARLEQTGLFIQNRMKSIKYHPIERQRQNFLHRAQQLRLLSPSNIMNRIAYHQKLCLRFSRSYLTVYKISEQFQTFIVKCWIICIPYVLNLKLYHRFSAVTTVFRSEVGKAQFFFYCLLHFWVRFGSTFRAIFRLEDAGVPWTGHNRERTFVIGQP